MTQKKRFDPNDPCLFCHPKPEEIIEETEHALLIVDSFPVNPGHMLVIPRRHIQTYFECTEEENREFRYLTLQAKKHIDEKYAPDAYNIGCNNGIMAGQSVLHLHTHIIPRYQGDVENPKGGVRWVVPAKSQYQLPDKAR